MADIFLKESACLHSCAMCSRAVFPFVGKLVDADPCASVSEYMNCSLYWFGYQYCSVQCFNSLLVNCSSSWLIGANLYRAQNMVNNGCKILASVALCL